MKKILTVFVLTMAMANGYAKAQKTEHFRHLMFRESPFASYRGIHPISAPQSDAVAHYQFSYDNQGRVIQISRKLGDEIVDDLGVWDSFIWFAPQVKITYQDNTETHTYFNRFGDQISAHGNVWQAVYQLDEQGRRSSLAFYDSKGEPTESEWHIYRYSWQHHEDGALFEKRFNLAGEQQTMRPELLFHEVKLEYDRDGKLAFMRHYGLEHKPTNNSSGAGIDRITYDLTGNFIRWQVYDKDGQAIEGNLPMVHLGEHLYDPHGNKIGLRGFDRYGNQIPFASGELFQAYEFNDHGARTAYWSYKPDWSLDAHFVFQYTDDSTSVTSVTSLDEHGNKLNDQRLRGAAQVQFSYDDNHRPVNTFYDAKGEQMTFE